MSGAGDNDAPSVSTSRSVRPPIGKSAGAASVLMTAWTGSNRLPGTGQMHLPPRNQDRRRKDGTEDAPFPFRNPARSASSAKGKWPQRDYVAKSRVPPALLVRTLSTTAGFLTGGVLLNSSNCVLACGWFPCRPARKLTAPPGRKRWRRKILAVVTALAAILLRHRRHHAPAQGLAVGEFHSLGHR